MNIFPFVFRIKDLIHCNFGASRATDIQSGTVSRFSSKLKGAIRGAIDGAPLEATEVPTVWDAFTDEPQVSQNCFKLVKLNEYF